MEATNFVVDKGVEETMFGAMNPENARKYYLGAGHN